MNDEIFTIIKIIKHTRLVSFFLRQIARQLEDRADIHDISKFSPDEFSGFCQLDARRNHQREEYGSKNYEDGAKTDAVKLHQSRNPHHPEYWPGGLGDMSLIDIIEMLCDWEAARLGLDTEQDTDKIWQMRQKRFNISDKDVYFLRTLWELWQKTGPNDNKRW
jgi:hypothetical protein